MAILQANKDYYLLRKQAYVVKFLDRIKHPNSSRISNEIIAHIKENFTKGIRRDHQNMPDNVANKLIDQKIEKILVRLEQDEPWEFIRGWAEFLSYRFKVNSSVLIPRVETEDLVKLAIEDITKYVIENKKEKIKIIDVGTGSGCIAISLEKHLKEKLKEQNIKLKRNQVEFIATDISEKALTVAKHNALTLKAKIKFIKANLIDKIETEELKDSKVFIISNPPYIPTKVCKRLQPSVMNFEPWSALDGGKTGDMYYQELFSQLKGKGINTTSFFFEIDRLIVSKIIRLAKTYSLTCSIGNDHRGLIRYAVMNDKH
jgi:release factor glutamine methyltransferase